MIEPLSVRFYGSCVSRDCARVAGSALRAVQYVARQSWLSAANPPVEIPPVSSGLTSAFQQRNLEGDFYSSAVSALRESPRADLTLLDLIDERLGVWRVGRGFVTDTLELAQSGWRGLLEGTSEFLAFGTAQHFDAWRAASERVVGELRDDSGAGELVLLGPQFAEFDQRGVRLPFYGGRSAAEWDALYAPYYECVTGLGVPILSVPQEFTVSHSDHLWGPAPFHYGDSFYYYVSDAILWNVRRRHRG